MAWRKETNPAHGKTRRQCKSIQTAHSDHNTSTGIDRWQVTFWLGAENSGFQDCRALIYWNYKFPFSFGIKVISDLLNISTTKAEKCCFQAKQGFLKAVGIKMLMLTLDHKLYMKGVSYSDEATENYHWIQSTEASFITSFWFLSCNFTALWFDYGWLSD